jgi:catechol 2,3-dioxygenase-like lactoylglutathione lyase family enzyme
MNLGWCDVCLAVKNVTRSRAFYEKLGFRRVEGSDSGGWAVMVCESLRLGLFEKQYMGSDTFSLNFRGGDVAANVEEMRQHGLDIESGPTTSESGGCSARLRDPDGYLLFLDTAPGETKKE